MKGLLLKDWYMMKKYCRAYLLIALIFITVSIFNEDNLFFIFYPCVLGGMIPVTLLAYDERSHWMQYSMTLPYTREQIVSAKYLMGVFTQIALMTLTGIANGIRMAVKGDSAADFIALMLMMLTVSCLSCALCLPLAFKLGTEKARIMNFIIIGIICAGGVILTGLSQFSGTDYRIEIRPDMILAGTAFTGIVLFVLSWYLSIRFFKKREL